jgi:predicted enzyme related to lactoylglutathione lyase
VIGAERTDFFALPSQDYERTRTFYRDTLGLPESSSSGERYVEFETGNVSVGFYTPREEFRPSSGIVALRVPDVAATRGKLEDAGIEFVSETIDSTVCHMAIFKDPDGNLLMLHHRYKPLPGE